MRLSMKDVVTRLGVTEKEVRRWVEQEGLPVSDIDGQLRFNAAAVFEWATERGIKLPASWIDDSSGIRAASAPTLTEALGAGAILDELEANDRREALAAMIRAIELPRGVDREALLDILLAREALASTGIGDGIAIPHVRTPIVLRVKEPVLVLALLKRGIEFGAIDKKPVHAIFLLVSPTTRVHLQLLSRLGFVLQEKSVRAALLDPTRNRTASHFMEILAAAETRVSNPPAAGTPS